MTARIPEGEAAFRHPLSLVSSRVVLVGDLADAIGRAWGSSDGVLLGTADDGIIWGQIVAGRVTTAASCDRPGARLRAETLLELRVFGTLAAADSRRELRIWRGAVGLDAACVTEGEGSTFVAYIDRTYPLLRGDEPPEPPERTAEPFVTFYGRAGEVHSPPSIAADAAALRVRQYLAEQASGMLVPREVRILGFAPPANEGGSP